MAAKKKAAKKAAKKTAGKKKAAAKAATTRRVKAISEPMTKTQITSTIAENTGLSKKDVNAVFEELSVLMEGHLKKRGAGTFTMPGMFKVVTKHKPARRARKGINPFTGEETMLKAKPASTQVKIRPLKKMKDMAN